MADYFTSWSSVQINDSSHFLGSAGEVNFTKSHMKIPFTYEQFLQTLSEYNQAVWPMQILFYLLAIILVCLSVINFKYGDKIITAILFFYWLWMGIVYHLTFFTTINKAAYLFASLFILQALLLFSYRVLYGRIGFAITSDVYGITGSLYIIFALIVYPLTGNLLGHIYPQAPTFGLPCPTTIFTFGMLLFTKEKVPFWLLLVPLAWSFIGFTASYKLGIWEDGSLLITGPLATVMILKRNKNFIPVHA